MGGWQRKGRCPLLARCDCGTDVRSSLCFRICCFVCLGVVCLIGLYVGIIGCWLSPAAVDDGNGNSNNRSNNIPDSAQKHKNCVCKKCAAFFVLSFVLSRFYCYECKQQSNGNKGANCRRSIKMEQQKQQKKCIYTFIESRRQKRATKNARQTH